MSRITTHSEKIRLTVEGGRVRLHTFEPSGRSIWTVVGTGREYWVEPSLRFCSCVGFYFSRRTGTEGCYHLKATRAAIRQGRYETVRFGDDEYVGFVASLVSGLQLSSARV